ncbi:MAG: efflux RND transporter permease subunit [Bacteroidales bacterium]|nr:efflux RND transporter permease subunit [Bacteroidales bacterium]
MGILNRIIRFSLDNRLLVVAGALLVCVGGFFTAGKMDVDVFPDLTAPTVTIMTNAHGMSPEEVERMVTFPIESSVNGADGVRRVRSSSMYGYSFVWVEFNWGADVFRARQTVSEKMVAMEGSLPEDITPVLAPQSSVMGEILFIGMEADSTSMMELRTLADWVIKPAILATGGVSQVTVIGGDSKQYQILADPLKMSFYGVTMEQVCSTAVEMSVNSEGGVIREYGNEYALRGIARSTDLDELGRSVVKMGESSPVFLSDVAELCIGSAVKMGYASHNASPAVILSVSKQPDINTLEVTRRIEENLGTIAETLPEDIILDTAIFRQADFIMSAVGNVARALLEGALFVILILFVFLGNLRTTVISVLAIPLSLLGTLIVINFLGMDINTMTLGGICIATGSLVAAAIIDVENVYKRLRQNHSRPPGQRAGAMEIVYEGSREIRSSVISATLIVIAAFIPLFFLTGMEGRMLKPLGITYIIALFVSLFVAMTLTPVLCHSLLSDEDYLERRSGDGMVSRFLAAGYAYSLSLALSHKKTVLVATSVLLVSSLALFFSMGRGFLPDFNEGSMTISAVTPPGTSLETSNELGYLMEKELLAIPEVNSTARRSGRGELDEHSQSVNGAEIDANFTLTGRTRQDVFAEARQRLGSLPGVAVTVGQPLGHRIDHMLSGTQEAIAIKIFGQNLSTLQSLGNKVKDAVCDIDALVDVRVEQQSETPQIQIRADREALARYGISTGDFNRFVSLAFSGEKVGDIYEGERRFDLTVRLRPQYTERVDGIRNALMDTPDGGKVPLEQVADIVSTTGPSAISRENVERKLVVSANVSGRAVGSVVDDIRSRISESVELPEGYRIEYGGQFESASRASRTLAIATILSLLLIFLLLFVEFGNVQLALLVLFSLPLSLIGAVFAVGISSGEISIPAIIGFITLLGIATRNGVLLISRYRTLSGSGLQLRNSIMEGSLDRLNPILMTALTSALALIPLIVNGDKAGNEIQSPMAVAVLGGLLTSTLLNIYVIPVIYEWYLNRKSRSRNEK